MIVKIIPSPANRNFSAVNYNTNKVDREKGELMRVSGFGPLQGFAKLRPQDYINYLQLVTAQNNNTKKPQFHAVISAKNKTYDKSTLTDIAVQWMKEMGYGTQPYLVVFHKDTANNHVHVVSTRIDKEGKTISSAWEHVRSQKALNKVLGYELAFQYRFSTKAQFLLLLETSGFPGRDPDEVKIARQIEHYSGDAGRINSLKEILQACKNKPDFVAFLRAEFGLELIFHSSEGKTPYGYTIIDHPEKQIYKGSEVLPLKILLLQSEFALGYTKHSTSGEKQTETENETFFEIEKNAAHIRPVWIADDVDDQQMHGTRRRKQKKAKTNTR
jgi:hypothetical protein